MRSQQLVAAAATWYHAEYRGGPIATKRKSDSSQARIVVGLPNLQDQIGMVNRASAGASEFQARQWHELRELLSDLYSGLQHQGQVTVHRFGSRTREKPPAVCR